MFDWSKGWLIYLIGRKGCLIYLIGRKGCLIYLIGRKGCSIYLIGRKGCLIYLIGRKGCLIYLIGRKGWLIHLIGRLAGWLVGQRNSLALESFPFSCAQQEVFIGQTWWRKAETSKRQDSRKQTRSSEPKHKCSFVTNLVLADAFGWWLSCLVVRLVCLLGGAGQGMVSQRETNELPRVGLDCSVINSILNSDKYGLANLPHIVTDLNISWRTKRYGLYVWSTSCWRVEAV